MTPSRETRSRDFLRASALRLLLLSLTLALAPAARASCTTSADMDPATRAALDRAAQNYFQMAARGDMVALRLNATTELAADFSAVDAALRLNHEAWTAAQPPQVRAEYLLVTEGPATQERAEFFCGVWPTPSFTVFVLNKLAPGRYAVVALEVESGPSVYRLSLVLEERQQAWKLAGFYPRMASIAGHDGAWYWEQARAYKSKKQFRDAWFYYLTARELLLLVPFMSNRQLEQMASELTGLPPQGLPGEKPIDFLAGGKVFRVAQVYVVPDNDGLQLVVQHLVADASKTGPNYADNLALIRQWIVTYPEYREAFTAVVARATDPSGREYGSRVPMKDIP